MPLSSLPTQTSSLLTPGRPRLAIPGATPPRSSTPVTPSILNHPIRNQRIRLDPAYLFVLAQPIAIQRPRAVGHARFRSVVVVLLKSPPI